MSAQVNILKMIRLKGLKKVLKVFKVMAEEDILSCSMLVDRQSNPRDFNQIQPRSLSYWQENSATFSCTKCDREFNMYWRYHHCRCCGYVFCANCSNNNYIIPDFITVPKPMKGHKIEKKEPVRVCDDCLKKLEQIENFRHLITDSDNVDVDINQIRLLMEKSNIHQQYANYYLSRFRDIQYTLPNHEYGDFEQHILWSNRKLFPGHDVWIRHLVLSFDYTQKHYRIAELIQILAEHLNIKNKNIAACANLMCTHYCQPALSIENCLLLMDKKILCPQIHEFALKILSTYPTIELIDYLPYLKDNALRSPTPTIFDWLINKSQEDLVVANELYWIIQIGLNNKSDIISNIFNVLFIKWQQFVPIEFASVIMEGAKFNDLLKTCCMSNDPLEYLKDIQEVIVPVDIAEGRMRLITHKIKIKKSATRPILLPFETSTGAEKVYLYKPEDVRKGQVVLSTIRTIDRILKAEGFNLNIIHYRVLPTSIQGGFIEIIPNCITLADVSAQYKMTLLNYMIDQNPQTSVRELRQRFLGSCAAYCAITHLLGVGDRHLDNIMITTDGTLFHIDYGFILGDDPKYISTPTMRISEDIVDALGGQNSRAFSEFRELCADKIYNTLRSRVSILSCLLGVLTYSRPRIEPIISEDQLYREIAKRFVPGESYHQARIQFDNRIDNSTSVSLRYKVIDVFHKSANDGIIGGLSSTLDSTKSYLSSFWSIMQNEDEA